MALISVLLIVAVLTAVIYQLLGRHGLGVAQSRNSLGVHQAMEYALGAESLVRQALYEDFSDTGPGIDTLAEPWAQAIPPFELDDEGFLEIQARDLNRCFNLNALSGEEDGEQHLARFKTLLNILGIPDTLADAVRDWVDPDESVHGFGAEDSEYLLREPPYRAPNAPMAHVSELRLLAGVEPEYLEALAPHVCVLPSPSLEINVNTASPTLFTALAANPNLDPSIFMGGENPRLSPDESVPEYDDVDKFLLDYPDMGSAGAVLSVFSTYFEVQVRAQVGDSVAMLTSVLHRHPETGAIRLISRDLGKDFRSRFETTIEDA